VVTFVFALIPLLLTVALIYAIFSIAIDVRSIRRALERLETPSNQPR
jgi:hypothetical protein